MSPADAANPHPPRLTHVDAAGAARMVDVAGKDVTQRTATASGRVLVRPEVVALLRGDGVPKGDALAVARVAGIMGAKRTPDLVPLCHPIALHGVAVDLEVRDDAVEIWATVHTADRTGVEMEALTAVSVAALALVDMVKAVDRDATVTDIRVVAKTGGRSGDWQRQGGRMTATEGGPTGDVGGRSPDLPEDARALVVTVSDRSHGGSRPDTSGPLLAGRLRECGFGVDDVIVVPDEVEEIQEALIEAVRMGYDVVLTTGGTGLGPRDVTPEATRGLLDRKATGLAEAIRATNRDRVPTAILSRGVAGTIGETLVINLPGSTGGVADAMAVLAPVLGHTVAQLRGGDH